MIPFFGQISTGSTIAVPVDLYRGFTGPNAFGNGNETVASSGSGSLVGINNFFNELAVPHGFVSGNSLSVSAIYANQTFTSLGVTPGTYTWTWGSVTTDDSFTANIIPTAVPEPSSLALLALPLGFLTLFTVRRRNHKDREENHPFGDSRPAMVLTSRVAV